MKQFLYLIYLISLVTTVTLLGVLPEQLQQHCLLGLGNPLPRACSEQENILDTGQSTGSAKLTAFLQLLQEYRPNAPWITQELLELSWDEFEQAFTEVVQLLTRAEKRWFYFCDKPQDYDQDAYWQQCLWQCMYYIQWLERLFILPSGELFYKETETTSVPVLACPVAEYITMHTSKNQDKNRGEHALYTLYAFYADCLAHFFCFSVDYASRERDNAQLYISCWVTSKLCLEKLEKVVEQLKDTSWYGPYYLSLKRYQEVYALLDEEFLLSL